MNEQNVHFLSRVLTCSIAGSFSGMMLVGGVLWFDVSSIGALFKTGDNMLLANLFLSGAMLKGAVIGAAVGTAMPTMTRRRAPASRPVGYRREATSLSR